MDILIKSLIIFGAVSTIDNLACIDEGGREVDMFIIYKFPIMRYLPFYTDGSAFAYLDSNNKAFRLGKREIRDALNPLALTLKPVYEDTNNALAHVFYNDEYPRHTGHGNYGHIKGGLAFDTLSGFWLIHSVPTFPPSKSDGYSFPGGGLKNGQMILCVTFKFATFNDIGLQLQYTTPHIHDSNLPTVLSRGNNDLEMLISGRYNVHVTPSYKVLDLDSSAGNNYRHFAKSSHFGSDLYHALVAPNLGSHLYAATWRYGTKIGDSVHGNIRVEDIDCSHMNIPGYQFSFKNSKDHSKFVFGQQNPYVCIGGINRTIKQFKRGGATMCLDDEKIWNEFKNLRKPNDPCGKLQSPKRRKTSPGRA